MTGRPALVYALSWCARAPQWGDDLNLSGELQRQVLAGDLDLVFLSDEYLHPGLDALALGTVDFAWLGSPAILERGRIYSAKDIVEMTVIKQSGKSVLNTLCDRWLDPHVGRETVLAIDSLIAMAGLAVAGLGVACLPRGYFARYVEDGRLAVMRTEQASPSSQYYAMFRKEPGATLCRTVAELAAQCCDFGIEAR